MGTSKFAAAVAVVLCVIGLDCAGRAEVELAPRSLPSRIAVGFPEQAKLLFDGRSKFESHEGAFTFINARPDTLRVKLPGHASEGLQLEGVGLAITVREQNAQGDGAIVGSSVVYSQKGRSQIWRAAPAGAEEWL